MMPNRPTISALRWYWARSCSARIVQRALNEPNRQPWMIVARRNSGSSRQRVARDLRRARHGARFKPWLIAGYGTVFILFIGGPGIKQFQELPITSHDVIPFSLMAPIFPTILVQANSKSSRIEHSDTIKGVAGLRVLPLKSLGAGLRAMRVGALPRLCRLDGDTEPCRSLADAIIETQQSEADDRRTRYEQRGEVDGIE